MTIAQGVQFVASLIAIFALTGLCKWLGLGGEARIKDVRHAKKIAFDALYGFKASDVVIDRARYSALVRDKSGRHALIRAQGVHFVARLVRPPVEGRLDHKLLTIDLQEPDFAPVTLNLGDEAQYWASGLRHIPYG
jgi:hypothetical protein